MKKVLLTVGMLAFLAGVSVAADDMNKAPATPASGQTMSTDKAATPAADQKKTEKKASTKAAKKTRKATMKKQKSSTMPKAQ